MITTIFPILAAAISLSAFADEPPYSANFTDAQRATMMAKALSDDTIWPSPEALSLRGHGPAREEFYWRRIYEASARLLGLDPKPPKYPAATVRHALATKLKQFSLQ